MCGYCIESGFIELAAFSIYGDPAESLQFDSLFTVPYLQETDNVIEGIEYVKKSDSYFQTIICRFYEQSIINGFDLGLSNAIISTFSNDAIAAFLDKMSKNSNDELWAKLGKIGAYSNANDWNELIAEKDNLLMYSANMLHLYKNWWLHGKNKEKAESAETRLRKTGIFDPIDNTTKHDFEKFSDIFPFVYFSLMFLQKYAPHSELIRQIALTEPHDVPFFTGEDLWLRRAAFTHCAREYGINFLIERLAEMSYELICYILLKVDFPLSDLHQLNDSLSTRPRFRSAFIDLNFTLSLIDLVMKQKKPYRLQVR